ncbi:MAG: hypothetical protein ABJF04_03110 [Reichenbachiella sp.]|uniref:hypothetical protein n=2 Tax=Reichenbachiella sp. TaxID=2184521 RepID=UPI0032631C83
MRKSTFIFLTLALVILSELSTYGQTQNYKKGLDAIQANRYHEAMVCFTKVVADEKFEISGKELSMAYAYLAVIRTAYLKKNLQQFDFNSINRNQGQIQLTIQEMVRAVKFQDNASKNIIKNSKATLVEISSKSLQVIGDSLLTFDENNPNEGSNYLASFAINQFGELSQMVLNDWQLHDILGLAHYHLGDRESAMDEFKKARAQFAVLEVQPNSQLHLRNYILSGNYFFKEKNNMKEAYQISNEGSTYTSVLINELDDNQMTDILKLNKIENRFRQYMARIDESGE